MTKNYKNLTNIIKSGLIKIGSDIPIKDKFLSGYVDEPYIFANIFFDDLENLDFFRNYTLIISPEIIQEYPVYFLGGWGNFNLTMINPSDTPNVQIQKLNQIKKFISEPKNLPQIILDSPKIRHHEVRFSTPIDIKKYLIGIGIGIGLNNKSDTITNTVEFEKQKEKLNKLLCKYNLDNVKIFNTHQIPKYKNFKDYDKKQDL